MYSVNYKVERYFAEVNTRENQCWNNIRPHELVRQIFWPSVCLPN